MAKYLSREFIITEPNNEIFSISGADESNKVFYYTEQIILRC